MQRSLVGATSTVQPSAGALRTSATRRPLVALPARPLVARPARHVTTQAERGSGGFFAGVLVGGAIFGTLGFLFAPQISKSLLTEEQRIKLLKFLEEEEEKDLETTKSELAENIAALNTSIDELSDGLLQKFKEKDAQSA